MTVKVGNLAGTDGTPPQVPPKLCGGRLEVESGRRLDADVDDVVGGDVGGRLKVTCHGRPPCDGSGEWTGGACETGRPLRRGLAGSSSAGVLVWCEYLVSSIAYLQEKEMC
jgi:hypothetical protein